MPTHITPPPPEISKDSRQLGTILPHCRRWLGVFLLAVLIGLASEARTQSPSPDLHASLIAQMYEWRNDPRYVAHKSHTDRWDRALLAFGQPVTDPTLTLMTATEAQAFADRGWTRWEDVAEALRAIEAAAVQDAEVPAEDDPYASLIAQMYEWRNDPRYVAHKSHTDRWDRALLAFGEPVTDPALTPMTADEAQAFADRGWTRWVDVATALAELEAQDPQLVPETDAQQGARQQTQGNTAPTVDSSWPTSISFVRTDSARQITLSDHFSDADGDILTFTTSLSGSGVTLADAGSTITLTPTGPGSATLEVTADDGQATVTAQSSITVSCLSDEEQVGSFCAAAQLSHTYSGSVSPYSAPAAGTTANAVIETSVNKTLRVRVYPDLGIDHAQCRLRGYVTIAPQTAGQTVPSGFTVTTPGGATNVGGTTNPGWTYTTCGSNNLTANKYRWADINYNIADDGTPGSTLTDVKLVYHDIGASGNTVQGTHDIVNIDVRDWMSTITASPATSTITEGTRTKSASWETTSSTVLTPLEVTISTDHRLVGYLDFRRTDVGPYGYATLARMHISTNPYNANGLHGHSCSTNQPTAGSRITCTVHWNWLRDGSTTPTGTVKLVWVDLDSASGPPVVRHSTQVATLTMSNNNDNGPSRETSGNYWIESHNSQTTTTIDEGGIHWLKVLTDTDPGTKVVGIEARRVESSAYTAVPLSSQAYSPLKTYVAHTPVIIDNKAERDFSVSFGELVPCNDSAYQNSCVGGDNWRKEDGVNRWYTWISLTSADDNYVNWPGRHYQFRVKDSSSTAPAPTLIVKEDDAIVVWARRVSSTEAGKGRIEVDFAKPAYSNVSVTVSTGTGAAQGWATWSVQFLSGESGTKYISANCSSGVGHVTLQVGYTGSLRAYIASPRTSPISDTSTEIQVCG